MMSFIAQSGRGPDPGHDDGGAGGGLRPKLQQG